MYLCMHLDGLGYKMREEMEREWERMAVKEKRRKKVNIVIGKNCPGITLSYSSPLT